jgi:nucleoside-diphosphate-sugar epimerase
LRKALDGITDVVLLAGLVGDPITKKYPEASHTINEDGIRNCIDQLNGAGLEHLVFVSTCSNYGLIKGDQLADENFELNPLSLYSKAKVATEQYIMGLKGSVDYSPTVLRFATAFGLSTRMRFDLTVSEFSLELALGKELLVYDAHSWRPYCHVQDFARIIQMVFEAPLEEVSFEIFNAGGDKNNATKQMIVDTIIKKIPDGKVKFQEHGSDTRNYRVSFKKIESVLGFKPIYTIQDGVDELINAFNSHVFDFVNANRNFFGNYEIEYR